MWEMQIGDTAAVAGQTQEHDEDKWCMQVFLALWRLGLRLNRRLGPAEPNAANVPESAMMVNAPAGGQ